MTLHFLPYKFDERIFSYLANGVRKANATWTGGSTGETLLQDANLLLLQNSHMFAFCF